MQTIKKNKKVYVRKQKGAKKIETKKLYTKEDYEQFNKIYKVTRVKVLKVTIKQILIDLNVPKHTFNLKWINKMYKRVLNDYFAYLIYLTYLSKYPKEPYMAFMNAYLSLPLEGAESEDGYLGMGTTEEYAVSRAVYCAFLSKLLDKE